MPNVNTVVAPPVAPDGQKAFFTWLFGHLYGNKNGDGGYSLFGADRYPNQLMTSQAAGGDELGRSLKPDGVAAAVSPLGQRTFLFDLDNDPGERVNVSAQNPKVIASLQRQFSEWDKANVPPQWTSRRGLIAEINGERVELFN